MAIRRPFLIIRDKYTSMTQTRQLSRDEIKTLPLFPTLGMNQITVVGRDQLAGALHALRTAKVAGFDTESRPTFHKGEAATGPHLIQLATMEHGYLFPVSDREVLAALGELMASGDVLLVGFDLRSDKRHLRDRFGIECKALLDVGTLFSSDSPTITVGAVQAVARVFGCYFRKSKKLSTSNWGAKVFSEAQQVYAANDAWVALRVYRALHPDA